MSTPSSIPTYTAMRSAARAGVVVFVCLGCASLLMSLVDVTSDQGESCGAPLFNPDRVGGDCAAKVAAAAQVGTAAAVAGLAFMVAAAVFAILGRRQTWPVPGGTVAVPTAPASPGGMTQPGAVGQPGAMASPGGMGRPGAMASPGGMGQPGGSQAVSPYGQQFSAPPGS